MALLRGRYACSARCCVTVMDTDLSPHDDVFERPMFQLLDEEEPVNEAWERDERGWWISDRGERRAEQPFYELDGARWPEPADGHLL